jgi:glucose/arabinose dehydrogenase
MPTTTTSHRRPVLVSAVMLATITGCASQPPATVPSGTPSPAVVTAPVKVIAQGTNPQAGLAFLPDGTGLVAELNGRILSIGADGQAKEVASVPADPSGGEGGLLSIAVSPDYSADRWVYVYYTSATDNRLARLRLGQAVAPILTGIPRAQFSNFGRIAFGPDGLLYVATGAVTDGSQPKDDPRSLHGKVLRVTPDGKPAPGNPDPGSPVYSYGHAAVDGLAWDGRGQLYESEAGSRLFELNRIQAGGNYGEAGGVGPVATWPPEERFTSGIAIIRDKVYAIGLTERLLRLDLDGKQPADIPLAGSGPARAIAAAPDGTLWVATAKPLASPPDGRILRITVP